MALPRLFKTQRMLCQLIQLTSPNALFSLTFASKSLSTLLTNIPNNNYYPSSEQTHMANDLISIFSNQPFSPESCPDLRRFASALTPKLVESALNGFKSWKSAHLFFAWASKQHGYKHNCYTYNAMASILSGARQNAALSALALDLVKSKCSVTPGGLGFFLRCLGSLGLVEEANSLFDLVKRNGLCVPNGYTYSCLLEVVSKSSSVDLMETRLKEMMGSGFEMTKYTLAPVLRAYCHVGEFGKAMNVFNDMYEKGLVDAHVFTILIVSFSKWGKVDEALELLDRMEAAKLKLNAKTFYVLINGFVKLSRVDEALRLFGKMRELGLSVDVSLFDVLIGGLSENKDLERVLCLYKEMKEFRIRPDARIVAKLVNCCSSETDMIRLLEEKQEDVDEQEVVLLYNSVLSCLVNLGSIDKAHLLLRVMIGDEASTAVSEDNKLLKISGLRLTSCFRLVIDGLLRTNKLDSSLRLFKDMIRIGCKPDQSICNNLIDGLCTSNRLEESYEMMRDMQNRGLSPTEFTYNSLYWCQCRRENNAGAFDLVKEMRARGHKPWIKYSSLFIDRLCKNGKVVQACSFLDDMLREGFPPHIVSYSAVLDWLVKAREVDSALNLLRHINDQGCCPDVVAYNIVINGLSKAQRISEAEDIMNEMVMKGLVPSVVTYNLLIDGWCKLGNMDGAMVWLSKMVSEKRDPSVITYTTLISGFCSAGKPDDAVALFDAMESKGCAPNRITFMALISGLCKCRRPDTALSYLRKMEEKEMCPDCFVYVSLLSAFLSDSNLPSALDVLKDIVDRQCIPDQFEKTYSVVRDAILKLLADGRTTLSVKSLIANGSLPTFNFSDAESKGEPKCSSIMPRQEDVGSK